MPVFPVGFCIDASKIVSKAAIKRKMNSFIVAGDVSTYIYTNENDYYNDYQESIFAKTTLKGGWDCLRHYEILANGCIPFFPNIENCPESTMVHFPKQIIQETNKLYEDMTLDPFSNVHIEKCHYYTEVLLNYTRQHLTNTKMAEYVLEKSLNSNAKSILYLSGCTKPDYLSNLILPGFKNLLGSQCHDYPRIDHINKDYPFAKQLYGKGFTYTRICDIDLRNSEYDRNVEQDIRNRKYNIIMYASYQRGLPFFDIVKEYYAKEEIILLCGEDVHCLNYKHFSEDGFNVFVREL